MRMAHTGSCRSRCDTPALRCRCCCRGLFGRTVGSSSVERSTLTFGRCATTGLSVSACLFSLCRPTSTQKSPKCHVRPLAMPLPAAFCRAPSTRTRQRHSTLPAISAIAESPAAHWVNTASSTSSTTRRNTSTGPSCTPTSSRPSPTASMSSRRRSLRLHGASRQRSLASLAIPCLGDLLVHSCHECYSAACRIC